MNNFETALIKEMPILNTIALRHSRNEFLVEELVAETLAKALENKHLFSNEKGTLISWLSVIMRNLFYDYMRQKKRKPQVNDYDDYAWDFIAPGRSTDLVYENEFMQNLKQLKPKSRQLIEMMINGYGVTEISEEINKTNLATRASMFRARKELREVLEPLGIVV